MSLPLKHSSVRGLTGSLRTKRARRMLIWHKNGHKRWRSDRVNLRTRNCLSCEELKLIHPVNRPELNRGPPMSRQIVHPTIGEDASTHRFDVAPVKTAELDAERERSAKSCEDVPTEIVKETAPTDVLHPDGKSVVAGGVKERTAMRRRRVKAGHYPLGFSPYLMSANGRGDVISLGRLVIKSDLKVTRPLQLMQLHQSLRLQNIIV
jgi:hypothetical protein